jgi:hypothetical protein
MQTRGGSAVCVSSRGLVSAGVTTDAGVNAYTK